MFDCGLKKISLITFISITVIILSYYYQQSINSLNEEKRLERTLASLLDIERNIELNKDIRVCIGYGASLDYFISSREIILKKFSPPNQIKHLQFIQTYEDLTQVFAYFFQHGAAAERFINNKTLFEELVKLSNEDKHLIKAIGGNAPLMAARLAKEGLKNILLGAQLSTSLREYLPSSITISGPVVENDEVHLLIEYPALQKWPEDESTNLNEQQQSESNAVKQLIAPRANRFIVHNDLSNSLLLSLENFHNQVLQMRPNVFVIGGLQMMDNYPDENNEREVRLQMVKEFIQSLQANEQLNSDSVYGKLRLHFEMASFTDANLLKFIGEQLLPLVDSVGMNEQELPSLYHLLVNNSLLQVSNAYPRVATVLDEMRDLYKHLRGQQSEDKRKLTRIHVHTLAFQAILVKRSSNWRNTRGAAGKAALTAHRHTCGSDTIDKAKTKLIMDDSFTTTRSENGNLKKRRISFNETSPISCWYERIKLNKNDLNGETAANEQEEEIIEFCVAPVLVCTKVRQTGGGGDNVSAAGLVAQL